MANRVAIVAVAQTRYHPNREDVNEGELAYEAIAQVIGETGLDFSEDGGIGLAITSSDDYWDGRTISNNIVQAAVGAHMSDEGKVCEDGLNAIYSAYTRIVSGRQDLVIVCSHMKESQADKSMVENLTMDPMFLRPFGIDYLTASALQARCYMEKYGITSEQCAKVAVKNRGNARNNPFAQEPLAITVDDVLNSEVMADPIRLLDSKPVSDGACAMILASEERARKLTAKPIWILGVSNCYEAHYLGERDLAACDALSTAAQKAYRMADIKDPVREIQVAEICEEFSYQELLWYAGLGLCGAGEGGRLIDSGVTQMGGSLAVNPSGGMLSGVPNIVGGMSRAAEIVLQLRGEAAARQVEGPRIGLAHGYTGMCGQLQCVMVLGN